VKKEETYWIPWNGEGERKLTFNDTQWILGKIVEERGEVDKEEFQRRLIETKERLQTVLSLTSVLVKVNGGTFRMGDEVGDLREECRPVHRVKLTYDYWIGKYAVTFHEYDTFCVATSRSEPDDEGWGQWTRPVINVSWWDAIAYCNWLSEKEGIAKAYDSDGNLLDTNGRTTTDITKVEGYRLPTEAEWENAARGGQKTNGHKYAGSDDLNEVGWYGDNSGRQTHPVGEKKGNELGLYDMTGNEWEWCHDWWGDYASTTQTNPTGPSSGARRVYRGGGWDYNEPFCRAAFRYSSAPASSGSDLGFRVVRTVF